MGGARTLTVGSGTYNGTITDHGVAQAYPDAMHTVEGGCTVAGTDQPMKILYGCEGYYVNDVDDRVVVHGVRALPLRDGGIQKTDCTSSLFFAGSGLFGTAPQRPPKQAA